MMIGGLGHVREVSSSLGLGQHVAIRTVSGESRVMKFNPVMMTIPEVLRHLSTRHIFPIQGVSILAGFAFEVFAGCCWD